MRWEETLEARYAGKDVRRASWPAGRFANSFLPPLLEEDCNADDWEVEEPRTAPAPGAQDAPFARGFDPKHDPTVQYMAKHMCAAFLGAVQRSLLAQHDDSESPTLGAENWPADAEGLWAVDPEHSFWRRVAVRALEEASPTGPCDFGWALRQLREGKRVCRAGWNGKGMWLYLVDYGMFKPHGEEGGAAEGPSEPFIAMFTAQRSNVPWLASQTDVLATDWEVAR